MPGPSTSTGAPSEDSGPGLGTQSVPNGLSKPDSASKDDSTSKDDSAAKDDVARRETSKDGNSSTEDSIFNEKGVPKLITSKVEALESSLLVAHADLDVAKKLTHPIHMWSIGKNMEKIWKELAGFIKVAPMTFQADASWENLEADTKAKLTSWSPHAKQMLESGLRGRDPLYAAWIWHILDDNLFSATGACKLSSNSEWWESYRKRHSLFTTLTFSPPRGLSITLGLMSSTFPSTIVSNLNLLTSSIMIVLNSIMVNCRPIQILGPCEKAAKA